MSIYITSFARLDYCRTFFMLNSVCTAHVRPPVSEFRAHRCVHQQVRSNLQKWDEWMRSPRHVHSHSHSATRKIHHIYVQLMCIFDTKDSRRNCLSGRISKQKKKEKKENRLVLNSQEIESNLWWGCQNDINWATESMRKWALNLSLMAWIHWHGQKFQELNHDLYALGNTVCNIVMFGRNK
jgi:hypothetical protein